MVPLKLLYETKQHTISIICPKQWRIIGPDTAIMSLAVIWSEIEKAHILGMRLLATWVDINVELGVILYGKRRKCAGNTRV